MYKYKVYQNGFWKDYSEFFKSKRFAKKWLNDKFVNVSNRELVLFRRTKKVK